MKRCPQCGVDKPLSAFWTRSGARAGQPRGACKDCEATKYREWRTTHGAAAQRRWRAAHPEVAARLDRRKKVKQKYGLTLEESEAILGRGCAICGSDDRLGIDHCHISGTVRDALCRRCNLALGHMDDDPERLRAAAEYLERHRTLDAGQAAPYPPAPLRTSTRRECHPV